MQWSQQPMSEETSKHCIEVSEDGDLTIGTLHFPDDCVSLDPEEAEVVLKLLWQWRENRAKGREIDEESVSA